MSHNERFWHLIIARSNWHNFYTITTICPVGLAYKLVENTTAMATAQSWQHDSHGNTYKDWLEHIHIN